MRQTLCYVTHDTPADGVWNMAVDDARLNEASSDTSHAVWLRFYGWSEPTLSLGYFQRLTDRREHPPSAACPVVRRPSGGGAIIHDRELTYSLVVPAGHPLSCFPRRLYDLVHTSLIAALAELGVPAFLSDGREDGPFLCFLRRAVGDVLIADTSNSVSVAESREGEAPAEPGARKTRRARARREPRPPVPQGTSTFHNRNNSGTKAAAKICGSAQRRRRGAVLQHGSVLLARSAAAPELPGIAELTGHTIASQRLAVVLEEQLKVLHGWELRRNEWSPVAAGAAVEAVAARYTSTAWTARR